MREDRRGKLAPSANPWGRRGKTEDQATAAQRQVRTSHQLVQQRQADANPKPTRGR